MPKKASKTSKTPKAHKSKDKVSIIKFTAEELVADLEIPGEVTVEEDKENSVYTVKIMPGNQEDIPLLIGYHGETVSSLQIILGLLVFKKLGEWTRVVVDVSDYRERRNSQLQAMAQSFAAQAITSGSPVYLPPLSPSERRIIHLALQERTDVETFSEGEGENRRLVIRPKQ